MDWLFEFTFWHWWILATVLLGLEVLIAGTFIFLWMGVSAFIVGILLFAFESMSLPVQGLFFAVFSLLSAYFWKLYLKKYPMKSDRPKLNLRGRLYIGRIFTLEHPIVNGFGKVKVDDTTWKISGNDCAQGTTVKVIDVQGPVLMVKPLKK